MKVFIQSFGCQMNDRDSENMLALLLKQGHVQADLAEDADLVLVNTCSIRELASQKAGSQLGRYGKMAALAGRKPVIGVTGCLAQQEGSQFLRRFPYVDFVLGPDAITKLPELVTRALKSHERTVDISRDLESPVFLHEHLNYPFNHPEDRDLGFKTSAYINVSKGCDFRCTFCVVPNTRGPERSANPADILAEAQSVTAQGARQIVLLGQNVNSYGKHFSPPFPFAALLRLLEEQLPADGPLRRIRFTTSHPIDLGHDLMACFAELPRLCPYLHLPVQSGDDTVLRRMKRLYTAADYRQRLTDLRGYLPSISLTTDIIVGFPGETEEQFQRTLDLVEEVRYTSLYAFKYSRRPNTPAERLPDDVPEDVKSERLARVFDLQEMLCRQQNRGLEGKTVEVLVEGKNAKETDEASFTGRTLCNRLVHFGAPDRKDLRGKLAKVRIDVGQANSLLGTLVSAEEALPTEKGHRPDAWIETTNLSR